MSCWWWWYRGILQGKKNIFLHQVFCIFSFLLPLSFFHHPTFSNSLPFCIFWYSINQSMLSHFVVQYIFVMKFSIDNCCILFIGKICCSILTGIPIGRNIPLGSMHLDTIFCMVFILDEKDVLKMRKKEKEGGRERKLKRGSNSVCELIMNVNIHKSKWWTPFHFNLNFFLSQSTLPTLSFFLSVPFSVLNHLFTPTKSWIFLCWMFFCHCYVDLM